MDGQVRRTSNRKGEGDFPSAGEEKGYRERCGKSMVDVAAGRCSRSGRSALGLVPVVKASRFRCEKAMTMIRQRAVPGIFEEP